MSSETDPVALLRAAITERLELARKAAKGRDGAWVTGCTCEGECRDYPSCDVVEGDGIHIYSEGGHDSDQAMLIAANDPRDTIARCEAELAILNEHRLVVADPGGPEQGQSRGADYRIVHEHPTERDIEMAPMMWHVLHCRSCRVRPPCRTVRLLSGAYRYRSGYDEKWEGLPPP